MNVSKENRPDPGFTDVPKTYKYYDEIAAAVDEEIFKGISAEKFEPNKILTRSEMAVVLQRLYIYPTNVLLNLLLLGYGLTRRMMCD